MKVLFRWEGDSDDANDDDVHDTNHNMAHVQIIQQHIKYIKYNLFNSEPDSTSDRPLIITIFIIMIMIITIMINFLTITIFKRIMTIIMIITIMMMIIIRARLTRRCGA